MRFREILPEATDDLTAEPVAGIDPLSRQPSTNFRIMRADIQIGMVAGRFAKTPEEAISHFRRPRESWWDKPRPTPSPKPQPSKPTSNWEIVPNSATIDSLDAPDDYYYHVTSRPNTVLRNGLRPNRKSNMDDGFWRSYSAGKVFLSDRPGVPYWLERIGQHLEAQYERPPKLAVLRIAKVYVPDVEPDILGARDSSAPAYYSSVTIR